MFLVDTSWDVSCAQYLPLVFRSLCASLLVVMTEMRRNDFNVSRISFGDKSDLETTKNISMETNFGIHHKLHGTKSGPS